MLSEGLMSYTCCACQDYRTFLKCKKKLKSVSLIVQFSNKLTRYPTVPYDWISGMKIN